MDKYINDWFTIIEQMSNDNTYKLAWGRALVECITFDMYKTEDDKVIVSFEDIAECMIKYYWNQIFFFNLKQAPYKDKEPVICKHTEMLIDEYRLLTKSNIPVWHDIGLKVIKQKNPDLYLKVKNKVIKTLHENVCWRFKNVPSGKLDIYTYIPKEPFIIFNKHDATIIKDYSVILSKLLNYKWAQLLEKFNYAPKIVNKVNGISESRLKRNGLTKYKNELLKQFENKPIIDFYTGEELDKKDISIDHVIPWSYMYSDDIWNLVITSKSYNSKKSNSIPSKETIDKLKERNEDLMNYLKDKYREDIEISLREEFLDKLYYECRL